MFLEDAGLCTEVFVININIMKTQIWVDKIWSDVEFHTGLSEAAESDKRS